MEGDWIGNYKAGTGAGGGDENEDGDVEDTGLTTEAEIGIGRTTWVVA